MGVIATWGNMKFEVSPERLYPLSDFATSFKLKSDANSDTSGTATTNTRGRELEEIKFSTRILAAAGVNVRAEFGMWRKAVGEIHNIIIGGASFGAGNFQLESVDISDTIIDMNGQFIAATLTFTFKEYMPASAAATSKATSSSSKSSKSSSKKKKSDKDEFVATKSMTSILAEKKKALNTTASSSDKASKSPFK